MKTNLFARMLLSILFYTNLLSTTLVMPLVMAARDDSRLATVNRDVQVWERPMHAPATVKPPRDYRLPPTDAPVSVPAARQGPEHSGPDAAMIKAGRVREKTIKL